MRSSYFWTLTCAIIILFVAEWVYNYKEERERCNLKDIRANIIVGLIVMVTSFFSRIVTLAIYEWVYQFRVLTLGHGIAVWVSAFIINDVVMYWYHRASHHINWFWLSHSVHHSSEYYNLSVSFRQSFTANFNGQFIFWVWLPLLGFEPAIVLICYQLGLFYQFFLHTELVRKLPRFVEFLFNTPSHHRVHHACNARYIDKNLGAVFIIWDRLFGTFEEETEKPVYGTTKPLNSTNPVVIELKAFADCTRKLAQSGSAKKAFRFLLKYPE